jgi:hypothetical protein
VGSKDLQGLLTRKHQHRKANEADWEAAKSDWLASVDAFCGNYRTKKMMITAWEENTGKIVPVAALIPGSADRINMTGKTERSGSCPVEGAQTDLWSRWANGNEIATSASAKIRN